MKWRADKILPIVLCLILPVLNAITMRSIEKIEDSGIGVFWRWLSISIMLYILWHILDFVSRKAQTYRWLKVLFACMVFFIIVYSIYSFTPFFQKHTLKWMFIYKYFLATIPFLIIQYAFRASRKVALLELEKQQIQTENYRVQLEALRSKVDPHFLFNSLNTLRTMVRHSHPQSEQFILSLSDFYRQTLKYNEAITLTLREEIKVLQSFLFLMQSRNPAAVSVSMHIDSSKEYYLIPMLALQLIAENCFKHNSMTARNPLKIEIRTTEDFRIEVKNNLNPKLEIRERSGYGIDNLNKRYELLGIKDGVTVTKDEENITVILKLMHP